LEVVIDIFLLRFGGRARGEINQKSWVIIDITEKEIWNRVTYFTHPLLTQHTHIHTYKLTHVHTHTHHACTLTYQLTSSVW